MIEGGNGLLLSDDGYNIQRSLRFRSSASAYLNRTPASAGNRKTWTWSGWVKRGQLGAYQAVFWNANGAATNGHGGLYFGNDDKLNFVNTQNNSTNDCQVATNAVFRDPSAWYHIVLTVDTTNATGANRVLIYVNGVSQALTISVTVVQNTDLSINRATPTAIGCLNYTGPTWFIDTYLAEVNFIDGQALTPSSFGQTDPVTGVWTPKKYTGTYGTNGFYLDFKDNTSATTLAYDKSGNSNNWTPNNISTTAGATYDSMTDVPTVYALGSNFATLNPLSKTAASLVVSDGNLTCTNPNNDHQMAASTIMVPSGVPVYAEFTTVNASGASNAYRFGVADPTRMAALGAGTWAIYFNNTMYFYSNGSTIYTGGSGLGAGAIVKVAYNPTNGYCWVGVGANWFDSSGGTTGNPSANTNPTFTITNTGFDIGVFCGCYANGAYANFGQRPFSYTPPTGFKALNTFNLPDPTIKKPNQWMDASLYTGTANNQNITNTGAFQPDFVWLKGRSLVSNHRLFDSSRGVGTALVSNGTGADYTDTTSMSAFNLNGFSVGVCSGMGTNDINANGSTYVGWQWKKGATPGFDIVTYTGDGVASNRAINHNLGVSPKMIIVKARTTGGNDNGWGVAHINLTADNTIYLNSTAAQGQNIGQGWPWFNNSSSFYIKTGSSGNNNFNAAGVSYVAYLFAEIAGFSKFGSFVGNGSADGPFVYCGFRPKYLLVKSTTTTGNNWGIVDASRDPYNALNNALQPNLSNAESGTNNADFLANGAKLRTLSTDFNASGATYIYAAFAENPLKYSLAR